MSPRHTLGDASSRKDAAGPGALVRFWSANPADAGVIRIYLDGAAQPVVEMPLEAWLGGMGREGGVSDRERDKVRIAIQPERLGPSYSFAASRDPGNLAATPPEEVESHTSARNGEARMTLSVPFRILP